MFKILSLYLIVTLHFKGKCDNSKFKVLFILFPIGGSNYKAGLEEVLALVLSSLLSTLWVSGLIGTVCWTQWISRTSMLTVGFFRMLMIHVSYKNAWKSLFSFGFWASSHHIYIQGVLDRQHKRSPEGWDVNIQDWVGAKTELPGCRQKAVERNPRI